MSKLSKWFKKNWISFSAIIISLASLIFAGLCSYDSNRIAKESKEIVEKEYELVYRPYVYVDRIDTLTDPDTKLKHPQVYVKNVGNIPAKVTDMFCYLYNQSIPMSLKGKTALVYPGQTGVSIEVDRTFEENKSPTLRIRIEYQDYSGREYYYDVTYRFYENLWIYIDSNAN